MGHSCEIKCNKCDYIKIFRMGVGIMYSPYAMIDLDLSLLYITSYILKENSATSEEPY